LGLKHALPEENWATLPSSTPKRTTPHRSPFLFDTWHPSLSRKQIQMPLA
jgi:hypothetical protein